MGELVDFGALKATHERKKRETLEELIGLYDPENRLATLQINSERLRLILEIVASCNEKESSESMRFAKETIQKMSPGDIISFLTENDEAFLKANPNIVGVAYQELLNYLEE